MARTKVVTKKRKEVKEAEGVAQGSDALIVSKRKKDTEDSSLISNGNNNNRKVKPLLLQDMCDDVLRIIYEFFGNVRDIYNLAIQSKLFFNLVTSEMIIRAAVFEKGLPSDVISRTIKALRDKSIYVPSTLRLLRLVNGKRCERLDQCWGYNMITSTSSKVCSVWMPGVFTCHDCAVGLSAAFNRDGAWASENDQVLKGCFGWTNKALIEPFYDKGTGERVGPVIPLLVVKQVSRSYNDLTERLSALSSIINEESKRDTNADIKSARMIECYDSAVVDAEAYNQRRTAEIAARAEARNLERIAGLRSMYDMLSNCLEDEPWGDAIMQCDWTEYGVNFHCSIVSRAVEYYTSRPSQINQKAMSRAATRIKNLMAQFMSTNILTADFLQNSQHPFSFVLYEYIQQHVTLATMLRKLPYTNQKFYNLINTINEGNLRDGLMLILHGTDILDKMFAFGAVPDVERLEMSTTLPIPMQDLFLAENFRDMAKSIWKSETASQRLYHGEIFYGHQEMTFNEAKYWWDQCSSIFSTRSRNIIDFFSAPMTIDYIEETVHDDAITDQKIKNLTKVFTCSQYKHLLQNRSYQSLLRLQRNQFRL